MIWRASKAKVKGNIDFPAVNERSGLTINEKGGRYETGRQHCQSERRKL